MARAGQPPLESVLLVPIVLLGRTQGVGKHAIRSAARRAGITPARLGNGRDVVSFAQAVEIVAELNRVARGPQAA